MPEYGAPPPLPDPPKPGSDGEPGDEQQGQASPRTQPMPPGGEPPGPPSAPSFGQPPNYGPPPAAGQQPPNYGPPPTYGSPGPGQPPPYTQPGAATPPPAYGQPPPRYGEQQPPQYGQPPYGQPYGQQPYGQPYGQPAYGGGPGYPGGSHIPADVRFASMGQRLGARLLDWFILLVLWGVVAGVFAVLIAAVGGFDSFDSDASQQEQDDLGALIGFGVIGVGYVLTALYEVGLVAVRGATFGKQIVGIKVVREEDGQVPGWGPSVVRWLIPFGASLVCGIVVALIYASPWFDSSNRLQGWHDKGAKTVVIDL